MSTILLSHHLPMYTEENQGNLYHSRWAKWRKNTWESIKAYVERFKAEILTIAPLDKSQGDLIWPFWKKLPTIIKGLLDVTPYLDSVEAVLPKTLEIANYIDLEVDTPEYTSLD